MDVLKEFPQVKSMVYLNTAGEGLIPRRAVKRLYSVIERIAVYEVSDEEVVELMDELRSEAARLIGARSEEVGLTTNTTTGLKTALSLIELRKGDNVVSFDLEFPTVGAVTVSRCRKAGCEVRVVRNRNGTYSLDDIEKKVDANTKAIILSSVEWVNGYRFDLKAVAEIAEKVGAHLVVDAVQHVGSVSLDVHREKVDFLSAGGEKWMLSPLVGCGILYVRKDLIEKYEPPVYGLMNLDEPEEGWGEWWANPGKNPWRIPKPAGSAVRYEWGGTPPLLGIVVLLESVKLLNEVGVQKIERNNLGLKEYLVERITDLGGRIVSFVEDRRNWSSITTFRLSESFEEDRRIVKELRRKKIVVAARGSTGISGIRVSPHIYNTLEDIDLLISQLKELQKY